MTINQISTLARLDTGATCTMIGGPLYEVLHAVQPLKLQRVKIYDWKYQEEAQPLL